MSIMNLHLEQDLAVIAANTDCLTVSALGHSRAQAGKIFALPDKSTVLCGRGLTGLMFYTYAWAHASCEGFDGLSANWEKALHGIFHHTMQGVAALGISDNSIADMVRSELMLVGRSQSRQSMAAYHATISDTGSISVQEVFGAVVPWIWGEHPKTEGSVQWMAAMAKRQAVLAEQDCPGKAWHGDLTVATMTADSMNLTTVREFWRATP